MRRNPVYSREMKVNSRSLRLPLILLLFNGILFLVTLLNMYSVVTQVRTSATIQYASFMELYEFVTTIEFILLLLIIPAVTASGISGERERQTLELMLTTQMTASEIVEGKLMSALSTLLLLILSSCPAVAMVFVYGGITWADAFALLVCYITVALFAGSAGLCFSAMFKRSTVSTVVTYGVLFAVAGGTYFINKFALSLSAMNLDYAAAAYMYGESSVRASSGGLFYLFLFNPAVTFFAVINSQAGSSLPMAAMCTEFGISRTGFVIDHWISISILLQLTAAAGFIWVAVRCVEPVKRRKRTGRGQTEEKKEKSKKKEES